MSDRRSYPRQACAELVNVSTATRKNRVGLTRNFSVKGVEFGSPSRFDVGERVEVLIHVNSHGPATATGRVVRTSLAPEYGTFYPYAAAVEFDLPCPAFVAP